MTVDLRTTYLGLNLKNPLVASSSPLTGEIGTLRQLEDAGAAAVVLPSLFQESIEHEAAETERLTRGADESFAEALSYFPSAVAEGIGPSHYLELIRRARAALEIPVIASLNGVSSNGWTDYARSIEQAGASALELNIFFVPTDLSLDGRMVEQHHLDVVRAVRQAVAIPLAVKLSPFFSAMGRMVRELDEAGADGFILFNRFYQPDIDLATLRLRRDLDLSTPAEIRLSLLWIGVLAGRIEGSLAAASGVETADEVIKYLLVGADVVMTAASLLRHGAAHLRGLLGDLCTWLEARDLNSPADIRGKLSHRRVGTSDAFGRGNYIRILQSWPDSRARL
jgi:dihydroorotate dehydrogenase (fumarate)